MSEMGLEKNSDYSKSSLEGQVNCMKVDSMKNVLESLMEHSIMHGVDVDVDNLALHDSRVLAVVPVAQVGEMTDDVRRVMKTFRRTDVVTSIVDFRMICIVVVSVGVVFDATMMSFGFGLAFNTRTIRTLMMTNRPKGMMWPKTVLAPTK